MFPVITEKPSVNSAECGSNSNLIQRRWCFLMLLYQSVSMRLNSKNKLVFAYLAGPVSTCSF